MTILDSEITPITAADPLNGQLFINGSWRESGSGERTEVLDPATGSVVGSVAKATVQDAKDAVAAAHAAFTSGVWSGLSGRTRARVLLRVAELIRERAPELARLESLDVGKPIGIAQAVDVGTAAEQYEYVASLTMQLDGSVRETPFPAHAFTSRQAIGVVAAITPFNFPLILSSTKIAAALAMGNSVVHKPATDTPLTALAMASILAEAGVPDGVVNVITGSGAVIGDILTSHPLVGKVAFTGSTEVGAHIAELAGRGLKPVTAELGGNGAHLVFADANLEVAIPSIIGGALFNAGQFCMAGTRILVERPIYETVVGMLSQAIPAMKVGSPAELDTDMGPLVSQKQLQKVESYIQAARDAGARIVVGGSRIELDGGFYHEPTLIADVSDQNPIVAEEVFGPVLTIQPFDDEDEAIRRANDTPYGLSAGVQTSDIARAHRVTKRLDAGMVWVNTWGLLDPAMPFGGMKQSGFGREFGPEALAAYTQHKSVVFGL